VDVRVTTPGGTSAISTADRFKFVPTVTGLSPKTGSKAGGTSVTVTGTGFALGTTATIFKFGTALAKSVNCTSTTTCTVVAPAHAVGTVDVKATVNKVSSVTNRPGDQFTYS
jgi:IPT/TIG domain